MTTLGYDRACVLTRDVGSKELVGPIAQQKGRGMAKSLNDEREYAVVVNLEEQFSIWAADRTPPPGWRKVGKTGTEQECLTYIEEVWTDMRPLSLRRKMDELG